MTGKFLFTSILLGVISGLFPGINITSADTAIGYGTWKTNKNIEKISSKSREPSILRETKIKEIDTSDWKTYKKEKYGFEFKFPTQWKIIQEANENLIIPETSDPNAWPTEIKIEENLNCFPIEKNFPSYYFDPLNDYSIKFINGRLLYVVTPYITYAGGSIGIFNAGKYFVKMTGSFIQEFISTSKFY